LHPMMVNQHRSGDMILQTRLGFVVRRTLDQSPEKGRCFSN
jgi:hypothetical protein